MEKSYDPRTEVGEVKFHIAPSQVTVRTFRGSEERFERWVQTKNFEKLDNIGRTRTVNQQDVDDAQADVIGNTMWHLAQKFRQVLRESGRPATTVHSTSVEIFSFAKAMNLRDAEPQHIDESIISAYVNDEKKTWKLSTRQWKLDRIRMFFKFCRSRGYSQHDPGAMVYINPRLLSLKQMEPTQRQPFTQAEVEKLLRDVKGIWHLFIAIGAATGLRIGDVANLEWDCVKEDHLLVWTRKKTKRVEVPMPPFLSEVLEQRRNAQRYVFPEHHERYNGSHRQRMSLSGMFKGIVLDVLGPDCRKSFHCLRHYFVTEASKNGKSMDEIAKLVGHSNITTTSIYNHA